MAKQEKGLSMPRKFVLWLISFVIITGFSGFIYAAVQQDMRQGANDPQIQMAEDTAQMLNDHKFISISEKINIADSLAPFRIVYDKNGKVTGSEAQLHGNTPELPQGIFDNVKNGGEERFTWQPESGVRIAAVVTSYIDGYVLAGRNIREVENREHKLMLQVSGVWIAAVGIVTVLVILL